MVSEFRPLIEVLRELRTLVQKKTSGFFFIATENNHSSTIMLRNGQVEEVTFSRYRNDEAIKQLARVSAARARFQPGAAATPASAGTRMPLSEAALQWLLGGFESDIGLRKSAAPAPARTSAPTMDASASRERIEQVALSYLGPIAPLLCDEAFSASNNVELVLQHIAKNLSTAEESERFLQEVYAALAKE
ncbi:hypothetical protein [Dyella sp.]|uniref:hypothetical protein n=1 Tax=Dyella sp. TaxID=1869338 RepID=UPI002BF7498E|nr:hypothetical protein [Dyella sp.]HTC26097.1 hypothetical protein [Dyella sp.]